MNMVRRGPDPDLFDHALARIFPVEITVIKVVFYKGNI